MSDLFWPGAHRAGILLGDRALLTAMGRIETAWLRVLHDSGVAADIDPNVAFSLPSLSDVDVEAGGNPVIPFVAAVRAELTGPTAAWLHRGLTSQDVLDTALVLCTRAAVGQVHVLATRQVVALRRLVQEHRGTVQAGRTLTQHAVPTTFGLTAATWLTGLVDTVDDLTAVPMPVQAGGAAGTLAATTALAGDAGGAQRLADELAARLGLAPSVPWHTNRRPITRLGDALTACVEACGRIANDVLVGSRPEIGELSEAAPGGSSTMPHKQNPVLSVLIRRAAISTPFLAATLHAAAGAAVDQRPDGAWHVEWDALRTLGRRTVIAMAQTADLLEGLVVHADRMTSTVAASAGRLLAEQQSIAGATTMPEGYLGANDLLIDAALARADRFTAGTS